MLGWVIDILGSKGGGSNFYELSKVNSEKNKIILFSSKNDLSLPIKSLGMKGDMIGYLDKTRQGHLKVILNGLTNDKNHNFI